MSSLDDPSVYNWILDGSCPLGMRNVGQPQKSHPLEERWANVAILSADRIWTGSVYTVSLAWLYWECEANERQDYKNPLTITTYINISQTVLHSTVALEWHCYTQRKIFITPRLTSAGLMEFCYTSFKYQLCLRWFSCSSLRWKLSTYSNHIEL